MNLASDILYLADILGKDRRDVKMMVQHARLRPENAHMILKHMLLILKKNGYDLSNLPKFNLNFPENSPDEGIFLGNVNFHYGRTRDLYLPVDSFLSHCLICGMTGVGKSTLLKSLIPQFVERGIYPWIFDHENEYKVLLKVLHPEELLILSPETDRDNFLEPPPGISPGEWIERLCNLAREVFYLRDGSINLLRKVLWNLYENKGVFAGGRNYPTIVDLMNLLESIEFKPGTRFSAYLESLINRFGGLKTGLGRSLECVQGFHLPDLLNKCVVDVTAGLSDDLRNFRAYQKMLKILAYREKLSSSDSKTLFVVDEAHKLYNKEIARRHDLGEPMIFGNARTFSKRGIMCFYSDQIPSELPPPPMANVEICMIMRLVSGRCISSISKARNLNPEQADYIPVMGKRECIIQSGDFPDPVLFTVPEKLFEPVSQKEVDKHMEIMFSGLEYSPIQEKVEVRKESKDQRFPGEKKGSARARPNRIWSEISKILDEVGYISLTDLYAHLGNLAPWRARRIVNDMEKQEMIELCPVSFGTRGNPKTFVVLKRKGAELIGVDFEDARLRGKGSTEHVILQNVLAEAMRDSGKSVEIEFHVKGKSVDVAEHGSLKSVAYELELQPSHPHVVENILRDLEAGFDEVVVITRNQIGQNEAKAQIYQKIDWTKLSKVSFKLIREFL